MQIQIRPVGGPDPSLVDLGEVSSQTGSKRREPLFAQDASCLREVGRTNQQIDVAVTWLTIRVEASDGRGTLEEDRRGSSGPEGRYDGSSAGFEEKSTSRFL